jgi:hypothetical protein
MLGEMLNRSPVFREQCRRLAAVPHVVVVIGFATSSQVSGDYARTQLMLRRGALERADVWVDPMGARLVETLGHEIEHVIERLDAAPLDGPGVRQRFDGTFETERAIRAGRAVAEEFRGSLARSRREARLRHPRTRGV